MSRPTVTRVTFDLPERKEQEKKNKKNEKKQIKKGTSRDGSKIYFVFEKYKKS